MQTTLPGNKEFQNLPVRMETITPNKNQRGYYHANHGGLKEGALRPEVREQRLRLQESLWKERQTARLLDGWSCQRPAAPDLLRLMKILSKPSHKGCLL